MVDHLGEDLHCGDIAVVHQLQILKPGSDRIPVILHNLSGRTLKLKRGTKVAHEEVSQVVPPLDSPVIQENTYGKAIGNVPEENQSKNPFKKNDERLSKILEKLDLEGIESWTEQQQYSIRKLLEEYQHLFALNLKELGKTSLVQQEIQLSDKTPFKERNRRIPPRQYE